MFSLLSSVYRQDLPQFLQDKLGAHSGPLLAEPATPLTARHLPSSENLDGHLSMPADTLKKMKHKQKQIILDKAAEGVNEALAASSDIPLCERFCDYAFTVLEAYVCQP